MELEKTCLKNRGVRVSGEEREARRVGRSDLESKFSPNKGFSLLEVIVIIGLGTLIILASLSIFNLALKALKRGDKKAEFAQNGVVVFDSLTRELRQAKEVAIPLPSKEIEFEDGHNPFPISYIRYYLNNGDFMREERGYYFLSDPDVFVKKTDQDEFGNPPLMKVVSLSLKAQYFQSLNFSMQNSQIKVEAKIGEGDQNIKLRTKVESRNL